MLVVKDPMHIKNILKGLLALFKWLGILYIQDKGSFDSAIFYSQVYPLTI